MPMPQLPNQPAGSPDWYSIMGNGDQSTQYMGAAGAPQGYFGAPYQQPQNPNRTKDLGGEPISQVSVQIVSRICRMMRSAPPMDATMCPINRAQANISA